MLKGIDVSEHQGRINWEKVKNNGIQFAILRAGYGKNHIDRQFIRNIKECNRLDIPVGVYWFSYATNTNEAKREAEYCLQAIKGYKVELPVCYDFEYDSIRYAEKDCGVNVTKRLATDLVKSFCSVVESNGFYAINYSNQDFILTKFYHNELERYTLWYAWYNSRLNRGGNLGIWQYNEKGNVDGISGNSVDMNRMLMDLIGIIRKKGLNNTNNFKPSKIPDGNYDVHHTPKGDNKKYLVVTCDVLNVRAGAGTGYKIVGQLKKGQKVGLDCKVGNWYSTDYGAHGGFLSADYVKVVGENSSTGNSGYGIVTGDDVNVRAGASLNSKIIGQVNKGDKFKLCNKVGDWWSTDYGAHGGFIYAKYIREV
ncbi:GH25 family lysozyme M1 (1,4-beta-N-acetylmuramidase)/uncharacterized protein YraI [Clostridium moniliforme]|uniref:GH25 family lysozyme M1 (1,4-beta-N-acetylmuramidase)/uncharacterized protein YraI n=1 Tax=Clostridium moniliforme TaxID=39489 RepID=A0ABS4F0U9_9CLOT|nr:GH25 family lysozyme [Clostridium moniliforme]MBP1889881.1 GH25 family lysozyme M1 (1,4-beta-N-acetylmuramidase)/uncharacterized protein YraI [Clostridium moniliforme]